MIKQISTHRYNVYKDDDLSGNNGYFVVHATVCPTAMGTFIFDRVVNVAWYIPNRRHSIDNTMNPEETTCLFEVPRKNKETIEIILKLIDSGEMPMKDIEAFIRL